MGKSDKYHHRWVPARKLLEAGIKAKVLREYHLDNKLPAYTKDLVRYEPLHNLTHPDIQFVFERFQGPVDRKEEIAQFEKSMRPFSNCCMCKRPDWISIDGVYRRICFSCLQGPPNVPKPEIKQIRESSLLHDPDSDPESVSKEDLIKIRNTQINSKLEQIMLNDIPELLYRREDVLSLFGSGIEKHLNDLDTLSPKSGATNIFGEIEGCTPEEWLVSEMSQAYGLEDYDFLDLYLRQKLSFQTQDGEPFVPPRLDEGRQTMDCLPKYVRSLIDGIAEAERDRIYKTLVDARRNGIIRAKIPELWCPSDEVIAVLGEPPEFHETPIEVSELAVDEEGLEQPIHRDLAEQEAESPVLGEPAERVPAEIDQTVLGKENIIYKSGENFKIIYGSENEKTTLTGPKRVPYLAHLLSGKLFTSGELIRAVDNQYTVGSVLSTPQMQDDHLEDEESALDEVGLDKKACRELEAEFRQRHNEYDEAKGKSDHHRMASLLEEINERKEILSKVYGATIKGWDNPRVRVKSRSIQDKERKKVRNYVDRVIEDLEKKDCPKLAAHLRKHIKYKRGAWWYEFGPQGPIEWRISL
jgi:hypothetical protein